MEFIFIEACNPSAHNAVKVEIPVFLEYLSLA